MLVLCYFLSLFHCLCLTLTKAQFWRVFVWTPNPKRQHVLTLNMCNGNLQFLTFSVVPTTYKSHSQMAFFAKPTILCGHLFTTKTFANVTSVQNSQLKNETNSQTCFFFSCICATTTQWPSTSSCRPAWTTSSRPNESSSPAEETTPRSTSVPPPWQTPSKWTRLHWGGPKARRAFSAVQELLLTG